VFIPMTAILLQRFGLFHQQFTFDDPNL